MPYHGTIKKITQEGQSWTMVVERPPFPDYVMLFDNRTFAVFFTCITGGESLTDHLLRYGPSNACWWLKGRRITTPDLGLQSGNGGIQ